MVHILELPPEAQELFYKYWREQRRITEITLQEHNQIISELFPYVGTRDSKKIAVISALICRCILNKDRQRYLQQVSNFKKALQESLLNAETGCRNGRLRFTEIDPENDHNVSVSTKENAYIQYSKATKERFDEIEKQKLEENSGKEKDEDTF